MSLGPSAFYRMVVEALDLALERALAEREAAQRQVIELRREIDRIGLREIAAIAQERP